MSVARNSPDQVPSNLVRSQEFDKKPLKDLSLKEISGYFQRFQHQDAVTQNQTASLKDRITYLDASKVDSFLTKRSKFTKGLFGAWDSHRKDKISKARQSAIESCATEIAKKNFNELGELELANLSPEFKKIILVKAIQCGNTALIKKCREIIEPSPSQGKAKALNKLIIQKKSNKAIEKMAKAGANLDIVDEKGVSLLNKAIENPKCNVETVKALINAGVSVDYCGENAYTALQLAVLKKRWDVVGILIKAGADPNNKGKKDKTPLELLFKPSDYAFEVSIPVTQITQGLDALYGEEWKKNKEIMTTIFEIAVENKHWEAVKVLIDAGADLNCNSTKDKPLLELLIANITSDNDEILGAKYGNEWLKNQEILELAVSNQNWELVSHQRHFGDFSPESKKQALQHLLDKGVNFSIAIEALKALYGEVEWMRDKEIMLTVFRKCPDFVDAPNIKWYIREFQEDEQFWIEVLRINDNAIKIFPQKFLDTDHKFWETIIAADPNFFNYLPSYLREGEDRAYLGESHDFWVNVLSAQPILSKNLPPQYLASEDFWIDVLAKNSACCSSLPENLNNEKFWIKAVQEKNINILAALPVEMRNNPEFWKNPELWKDSPKKNFSLINALPDSVRKNDEFQTKIAGPIAAMVLQKKFRKRKLQREFKEKLKTINPQDVENQKQRNFAATIPKTVREPLEDLEKSTTWTDSSNRSLEKAQIAITKAAKLGSYDKFKLNLRSSFSDTLQSISSSPEGQKDYVIIADSPGKSSNWAIGHLYDLMSIHPPTDIVPREQLEKFLLANPHVKHIVMVDDGAYSGSQASSYISDLTLKTDCKFHITIPYMTSYGKKNITKALQNKRCQYEMHDKQIMLSYAELVDKLKIFSFTGYVTVDNQGICGIKDMPNQNNLKTINEINTRLNELRLEAAKNPAESRHEKGDEQSLYYKILDTMKFIDNSLKELGENENLLNAALELIKSLFKTMISEESETQRGRLLAAYVGGRWLENSKTATWFSHKGADGLSTDNKEMQKIAGGAVPIEPYKINLTLEGNRAKQIDSIKLKMGENTLEKTIIDRGGNSWLKDRVDFVHTNRGFFLLGNSYVRETDTPHLILRIRDKEIKLGGKDGEYQYQLKEGDVFQLLDPITNKEITLKLNNGALQIVRKKGELWKKAIEKAKKVSKGSAVEGALLITEPYYLEVLPIKLPAQFGQPEVELHLYREYLDYIGGRYREKWINSNSKKSFQDYMYEDIGPNLSQEERQTILSNSIEFLNEQDRMKYASTLEPDGSIVQNGHALQDGEYMFVVDSKTKQLFTAKKERGKVHHSTLLGGQAVLSAGMIKVQNGKVSKVWGYSGHYKPGKEQMAAMQNFMQSKLNPTILKGIEIDLEGWRWGI